MHFGHFYPFFACTTERVQDKQAEKKIALVVGGAESSDPCDFNAPKFLQIGSRNSENHAFEVQTIFTPKNGANRVFGREAVIIGDPYCLIFIPYARFLSAGVVIGSTGTF